MKKIIIVIIILLILAGGGFFAYKKFFSAKKVKEESRAIIKKRPQINLLEIAKRPYVTLYCREDGKEMSFTIDQLKNRETKVDYELEYQTGTLLQSGGGTIDLETETTPVERKILLGSCSAGGKCSYDENITGGSLTLYFEGKENYGLKGEFTLNKMSEAEGVFNSRDVKTSLDVGKNGLAANAIVIVFNPLGLPGEIDGQIIGGPTGFFTLSSVKLLKAVLTFKSHEDLTNVKIFGWIDDKWQEFETEIGQGLAKTSIDTLGTFVLVK